MATRQSFERSRLERMNRYFSEEFKKKKVSEIERNLTSIAEVSREYEVSRTSICRWIYKYSTMRKRGVKQVVESQSDTMKIKRLKDKIKELEQIIGQKQVQLEFSEKMIEVAEEIYGIDIKKKLGSALYNGSGTTGKNTGGK